MMCNRKVNKENYYCEELKIKFRLMLDVNCSRNNIIELKNYFISKTLNLSFLNQWIWIFTLFLLINWNEHWSQYKYVYIVNGILNLGQKICC